MHYQTRKHTRRDPLDAILDHIQKNPHTYIDKAISYERNDNIIHIVNMGSETIYKTAEKKRQRKYVLRQGWSMKI